MGLGQRADCNTEIERIYEALASVSLIDEPVELQGRMITTVCRIEMMIAEAGQSNAGIGRQGSARAGGGADGPLGPPGPQGCSAGGYAALSPFAVVAIDSKVPGRRGVRSELVYPAEASVDASEHIGTRRLLEKILSHPLHNPLHNPFLNPFLNSVLKSLRDLLRGFSEDHSGGNSDDPSEDPIDKKGV